MRVDNPYVVVFLLVSTIFLQVRCTFLKGCERGNVGIGKEIRDRISVILPDTTNKYIAMGDKIFANLVHKLPTSNVQPLVYLKPLLEQYISPCANTSKFLNSTLEVQSGPILSALNRILNNKDVTCTRATSLDEYYLVDLLSSENITVLLDLDKIVELESPLNKVLTSLHALLRELMGTLGETVMYKLPWLVKHAISDMMSNISNIVMDLVTNVLLTVLITRSEVMADVLGDCLQNFECYSVNLKCNMADPCEKLDLAIETIIAAIKVDFLKSVECVEERYVAIAKLKSLEDVMNIVIL